MLLLDWVQNDSAFIITRLTGKVKTQCAFIDDQNDENLKIIV